MLGEKVQGWQWLAVVSALLGIILIFDPLHIKADAFSMFLALSSGVFWAISAIISKKLHKRAPHLDLLNITAWPMLLGSIPLVIYALMLDAPPIQWTNTFIAAVLFNVILSGVMAVSYTHLVISLGGLSILGLGFVILGLPRGLAIRAATPPVL